MAALVSRTLLASCSVTGDLKLDSHGPDARSAVSSSKFRRHSGRKLGFLQPGRTRALFRNKWTAGSSGWGPGRRRSGEVWAMGTDDSFSTGEMTLEDALKLLGVGEGASFDEILGAKRALVDSSAGDQYRISQLEAAYDTLLMQSLSQRRSGKVLDSSIRYADVRRAKSLATGGGPDWLKGALQKAPVGVQTPTTDAVVLQTGIYGALVIWTLAAGLSSTNPVAAASGADTPGYILAIGFGASLYFLRKQNLRLAKATLITVGGLVAGAVLGGLVESYLRVDIVPLGGISSPAIIVSEFVLISLYLSSLYLR